MQELLKLLAADDDGGDRLTASLITGITRGTFPFASPSAVSAVKSLKELREGDRQERELERRRQETAQSEHQDTLQRKTQELYSKRQQERAALLQRFFTLLHELNVHSRGYLLEIFLSDLFEFEELQPRRSFRLIGEQIDGSFAWNSRTHLVEAKWVREPCAGAEFGAFAYKIDGKAADTRGLFISINGYSQQAILGLNGKGALKFVCVDGAHITRSLSVGNSLPQLLRTVWRHAEETGEAYYPVSQFAT